MQVQKNDKENETTDKITKITKKANQMDKHLRLMEDEHSELLTHPVMKTFMHLKWHPNVVPNFINFLTFFMFLVVFSTHALLTVDFLNCGNIRESIGNFTSLLYLLKINQWLSNNNSYQIAGLTDGYLNVSDQWIQLRPKYDTELTYIGATQKVSLLCVSNHVLLEHRTNSNFRL